MTGSADLTGISKDDPSKAGGREPKAGAAALVPSGRWLHLVAVVWIVVLAGATLAPAFTRGLMIGPYDLLAHTSLTSRPGVVLDGNYVNTDPIFEMIQWTRLNWIDVHHGVLPLWNPYNGLGLPLAFNWQSTSFGVPSLIGYLLPLRYAYTAGVVATLIIAGTGAYVLARVLRLGFLGALMVATVFELGGPLVAWLGYPQGQVMAWGGWLFAAGVLVVRGNRRVAAITLFAVVTACSIYAGHPETLIVMAGAMLVFLIVLLALRAMPSRLGLGTGPIRRPVLDLGLATVAGGALGAPLLLPALQLTAASVRTTTTGTPLLPAHDMLYLIFSGFDGVPVAGNYGFGGAYFYNETAAYVGIVAAVLALVAVVTGIRLRRHEVIAATAVVVVMGALAYLAPVTRLAGSLPLIGEISWLRALMPLSLVLAVLAGMGMDAVVRYPRSRSVPPLLLGGFGAAAVLLAGLWLFGRDGGLPSFSPSLAAHVRAESFAWPVVGVTVGLAGAALLWWRFSAGRVVGSALLVCEALFLVAAGSIQIASSANASPPTPAITALQRAIGGATVGTGANPVVGGCPLGITPEANLTYQVHELDLYDPIVPKSYFTTWRRETGTSAGNTVLDHFCPPITTATEARLLGVGYVLEAAGHRGPSGSVFVTELRITNPYPASDVLARPPSNEDLYQIPGAAPATLTPIPSGGALPSPGAPGRPVPVIDPNPARWRIVTVASTAQVLRLHLTNVPGWHATIDGRPLDLDQFSGIMFQARIPPGRHVIELHYWPKAFAIGLVLALGSLLALAGALVGTHLSRRRRRMDRLSENLGTLDR